MSEITSTSKSLCTALLLYAALLLGALVWLPGCAHRAKREQAQRVAETTGELSAKEALRTSVESVDKAGNTITLRDADGRPFTIVTGDAAALEHLHPNDPVRLVYQEAVAFQLQDNAKTGESPAPPPTTQRYETQRLQNSDGVEFRRRVDTVVEILAVEPEGKTATFRIPEGNIRAVEIDDLRNREKVKRLRPGDAVAVVYTEKLLLEPDK